MRKTDNNAAPPRLISGAPARHRRTQRQFRVAILALTLVVCGRIVGGAEPSAVLVVVNRTGPLTTATADQIRDMFLGKLRLVSDVRVQPIQLEGRARQVVLQVLLGMSEREFQLYWMRKAYEDGVLPPPVRASAEEVLQDVGREKGAIGFVDAASIRASDQVTVVYEVQPAGNSP